MEAALDIFLPVMESATILAAHYAKACGRDVVIAQDMKIGLMYSARYVTGKQIGTLFPEIYDDSDSDEEEDEEEDEDEDPEWARYEGTDDMAQKMNDCMDTWGAWEPESPAESALKASVDKMNE
jgi:hypothetical protein